MTEWALEIQAGESGYAPVIVDDRGTRIVLWSLIRKTVKGAITAGSNHMRATMPQTPFVFRVGPTT